MRPRPDTNAFAGDVHRVSVDGLEINYRSAGAGPPVVLVHGWPTSGLLWRHVVPMLASEARVLAPDLPGLGASPGLAADRRSWEGYVDTLVRFLDAVDAERAALVGHDIGAAIVLFTAIRHPGRVERLAVLNTTPFPRMPWIIRALVAAAKTPAVGRIVTSRAGLHVLFRIGTRNPRTSVPELVHLYLGPVSTPQTRRAMRNVLTGLDPEGLAEVEAGLGRVTCPALLLWADDDVSGPMWVAQRLHERLQTSTLRIVAGSGHFVTEDAPDEVGRQLLEFLQKSGG